jgi:hypothetical protein
VHIEISAASSFGWKLLPFAALVLVVVCVKLIGNDNGGGDGDGGGNGGGDDGGGGGGGSMSRTLTDRHSAASPFRRTPAR